jgi:type 1 fimbriae regulatory protein FimB/type 1 fimbriae regulatory protein FimE
MYRHGLRVGEVVRLRWEQVHLDEAQLSVLRLKRGKTSVHPLTGEELRALRQLRRDWPSAMSVFLSERGAPPPMILSGPPPISRCGELSLS